MSTIIDISELVEKSKESGAAGAAGVAMTAMGGTGIPAAGDSHERGVLTNDPAALLQAISAAGVPRVELPSTSLDQPPTTPGM